MAEDIIVGLSSVRWLAVIAKGSSFQFRGDRLSGVAAGKALGARYVVSGDLAHGAQQLRLTVMLEDVSSGRVIWSRRFERDFQGIIDIKDEIGGEIVAMLEKEVDRVEQQRTFQVPWESLENWQLVRRGRFHMERRTREDTELALGYFQKAQARDPNSSAVLNELAWWHFWRSWITFGRDPRFRDDLAKVVDYANKALFMDSQDARPHAHLGIADIMLARPASALDHLREAMRINPSFAFARSAVGSAFLLLGEFGRAIPNFIDAERLSPFDPYRFHNYGELAAAYSFEKDFEAAVRMAEKSLSLSPGYWYARLIKVGALARLGRVEETAAELGVFDTRHPDFSIKSVDWIPFADKSANAFLAEGFLIARERTAA